MFYLNGNKKHSFFGKTESRVVYKLLFKTINLRKKSKLCFSYSVIEYTLVKPNKNSLKQIHSSGLAK